MQKKTAWREFFHCIVRQSSSLVSLSSLASFCVLFDINSVTITKDDSIPCVKFHLVIVSANWSLVSVCLIGFWGPN